MENNLLGTIKSKKKLVRIVVNGLIFKIKGSIFCLYSSISHFSTLFNNNWIFRSVVGVYTY